MSLKIRMTVLTMTACVLAASGCGKPKLGFDRREVRIDACETLRKAAADPDSETRGKAMEALVFALGDGAGEYFSKALRDPEPSVRFQATLAAGDLKYESVKPRLLEMAQIKVTGAEVDKRVHCGVIYALYRLGNVEYAPELGRLLFDPEREVRAAAALVMGRMGEPSAIPPLKTLHGEEKNQTVKLQALESLARLGDEQSATQLEAFATQSIVLQKLVAVQAAGWFRSRRLGEALRDILYSEHYPPTVRVLAAGALARIGNYDVYGYELCMTSSAKPRQVLAAHLDDAGVPIGLDVSLLQAEAVRSLGWMGATTEAKRNKAIKVLIPLLKCPDGSVRVAAATSILRLIPPEKVDLPVEAIMPEPSHEDLKVKSKPEHRKLYSSGWKD